MILRIIIFFTAIFLFFLSNLALAQDKSGPPKDKKWKEIEFFKSNYIASKDVNAWLGLYEVLK